MPITLIRLLRPKWSGQRSLLTQVKENQAVFLQQCKLLHTQFLPLAETIGHEKEHGRVTTRSAHLFSLTSLTLDSRWKNSGLSTLIVVERETFETAKQKFSFETSYYVSNAVLESGVIKPLAEELTQAIRCHWGVESNNWIRDVTFNEDHIKTKAGNQSQIMALLRGLAIELIRKTSPQNFQAAIENFTDSVSTLESMLKQVKFLWESRAGNLYRKAAMPLVWLSVQVRLSYASIRASVNPAGVLAASIWVMKQAGLGFLRQKAICKALTHNDVRMCHQ